MRLSSSSLLRGWLFLSKPNTFVYETSFPARIFADVRKKFEAFFVWEVSCFGRDGPPGGVASGEDGTHWPLLQNNKLQFKYSIVSSTVLCAPDIIMQAFLDDY